MSGSFLRLFLVASALVLLYLMIVRPTQLGRIGRTARLVGTVYVVAILISAVIHLTVGWGT
jgi:hypothetical protein